MKSVDHSRAFSIEVIIAVSAEFIELDLAVPAEPSIYSELLPPKLRGIAERRKRRMEVMSVDRA